MKIPAMDKGRFALIVLLSLYVVAWIIGNRGLLFDPMLQNDDVRFALFAFHQYDVNPEMASDPIAADVLNWVTPGLFVLYRVIVPLVHLPIAVKIVQGISLVLIILAAVLAGRNGTRFLPRTAVLLFFVLHTPPIILALAGGLQRAFTVPSIMLWIAGAFRSNRNLRIMAIVLAGLTYPVVAAILLATEFIFNLFEINWADKKLLKSQITATMRTTLAIVILTIIVLSPSIIKSRDSGGAINLGEAMLDPAFTEGGRFPILPFENPLPEIVRYFISPLRPSLLLEVLNHPNIVSQLAYGLFMFGLLLLTAFVLRSKKIPVPKIALSLFLGTTGAFFVARIFAFHLYFPDRYIDFGLPLACIAGIAEVIPSLKFQFRHRNISQHVVGSAVILAALMTGGDGIDPNLGVEIDGRIHETMFQHLRSTPLDSRVACHPNDCDDIPFWTARPSTGGYETILPIFVDSWERSKSTTEDVLRALYARDWDTINEFTEKYQVTHLLLNEQRYGVDFIEQAALFEPFDSWIQNELRTVSHEDLVLGVAMDSEAVVFRDDPFVILDVRMFPIASTP